MLSSILLGFLIGFVLAVPPGPMAVTVMRLGLDKGQRNSTLASLGAGTMDVLYCLMAISATSAAMSLISGISSGYPMLTLILQMAVVGIIMMYGIINIRPRKNVAAGGGEPFRKKIGFLDTLARKGPFLLGIAVSAANMVSPTFLPSLAWVTINVHKLELIKNTPLVNLMFCVGFGLGNFAWLYLLVKTILHFRDRMSANFLTRLYKFAGFTLIGFGTLLGYRVLTLTKWSEIIRLAFAF